MEIKKANSTVNNCPIQTIYQKTLKRINTLETPDMRN